MIKVLIVDDEYIMRQGLKYMINWEQEGFEIVGEATNGAEALQCIEALLPQIIIAFNRQFLIFFTNAAVRRRGFLRGGTPYVSEDPDDHIERL